MTSATYDRAGAHPEALCNEPWSAPDPCLLDPFAGLASKTLTNDLRKQARTAPRRHDPESAFYFSTLLLGLTVHRDGLWTEENTGEPMRLATPLTSVASRPDPNLRRRVMDRGQRPGSDISAVQ